jgi:hypothetical protein
MREIKFRGKRKDNGEWIYGSLVYVVCGHELGCCIVPLEEAHISGANRVIPETIGEYTGQNDGKRTLKFPKGQEIWEGDIVKASIYQGEEPQILPVYFNDGAFWIDYEESESDRVPIGCFAGTLEVIGDIYEK